MQRILLAYLPPRNGILQTHSMHVPKSLLVASLDEALRNTQGHKQVQTGKSAQTETASVSRSVDHVLVALSVTNFDCTIFRAGFFLIYYTNMIRTQRLFF